MSGGASGIAAAAALGIMGTALAGGALGIMGTAGGLGGGLIHIRKGTI